MCTCLEFSESDGPVLAQDPSLRILFYVMTQAWGDDPDEADPEDDGPNALMDNPSDDPYAAAEAEAEDGELNEAGSPGASLEASLDELNTGSHGASLGALLDESNDVTSPPGAVEALLAELNDRGSDGASLEASLGERNEPGSDGASLGALLDERNEQGSHGASLGALDSEINSIAAKMNVLQSLGFALTCIVHYLKGSCCNRSIILVLIRNLLANRSFSSALAIYIGWLSV